MLAGHLGCAMVRVPATGAFRGGVVSVPIHVRPVVITPHCAVVASIANHVVDVVSRWVSHHMIDLVLLPYDRRLQF